MERPDNPDEIRQTAEGNPIEEAGISREDREEILERINAVVSQNRISTDQESYTLKNVKRGTLFPLAVNAGAVLLIILILLILGSAFRTGERNLVQESMEYQSIEGQLIRELRRESQERISAKEREIREIESRLIELERQRADLEENLETRLDARRQQYDGELIASVQAERLRLESQGINSAEIDRLLAIHEAELREFYDEQLEAYRQQLLAEQAELQANIDRLRDEYNQQLAGLRAERDALAQEYRQQELSLRSQLEQRTRILEEARTEAVENLESARAELARLEIQTQTRSSIETQLLGQYERLQSAIADEDWNGALDQIAGIRGFLNVEEVAANPAIQSRRVADLFFIATIEEYLRTVIRSREDFASVSGQLQLLSRISLNRQQAQTALDEGDVAAARAIYQESVALIPELESAHSYLLLDAVNQLNEELEAAQLERTLSLEQAAQAAGSLVAAGNYPAALEEIRRGFALIPELDSSTGELIQGLAGLGYALADELVRSGNSAGLAANLAETGIDPSRIADSLTLRINQAVRNRENELFAQMAENDSEVAALIATYEERLETQNASLSSSLAGAQAELNELSTRSQELERRNSEVLQELQELRQFEELVETVRSEYQEYQAGQQEIRAANPEASLAAALALRTRLESFLGSRGMSDLLPGFAQDYRGSDSELQEAGREDGLLTALDIISSVTLQGTAEQQQRFLDQEIDAARADGDESLEAFLLELQAALQ